MAYTKEKSSTYLRGGVEKKDPPLCLTVGLSNVAAILENTLELFWDVKKQNSHRTLLGIIYLKIVKTLTQEVLCPPYL